MKNTSVALISSAASITAVYYFERKKGYAILDSIEVLWNKVKEGFQASRAVLLEPSLHKFNYPDEDRPQQENKVEEDLNIENPNADKEKSKQVIINETKDAEKLVKVVISDKKGFNTDERLELEKVEEKSKQEMKNNAEKDLDLQNIDPYILPSSRPSASQLSNEQSSSQAKKFSQRWLKEIGGEKGKQWCRKFIIKNIFKKRSQFMLRLPN